MGRTRRAWRLILADFRPHVGPLPRTRLQMPTPGHREARFQNAVTPGHRDTGTPNLRKVHWDTGRQYFKTLLHRDTGTPDLRKVHRHTGRPHTYETRVPVAMSGVPDVRVEVSKCHVPQEIVGFGPIPARFRGFLIFILALSTAKSSLCHLCACGRG